MLMTFDVVLERFEKYFIPQRNIICERVKLNRRMQGEGEPVEEFTTALHRLAESCAFGALRDELICDRPIAGLQDHNLEEIATRLLT